MIFGGGKARDPWRCCASAKERNDATVKKHPACGGANRLPGFVAALARYRASRCTPRLPGKPICRHQIDPIWSDSALTRRWLGRNFNMGKKRGGGNPPPEFQGDATSDLPLLDEGVRRGCGGRLTPRRIRCGTPRSFRSRGGGCCRAGAARSGISFLLGVIFRAAREIAGGTRDCKRL